MIQGGWKEEAGSAAVRSPVWDSTAGRTPDWGALPDNRGGKELGAGKPTPGHGGSLIIPNDEKKTV